MTASRSAPRSTSSEPAPAPPRREGPGGAARRALRAAALAALVGAAAAAVAGSDPARTRLETQYRAVQAQLQLARTNQPYLLFDWPSGRLELKLRGVTVHEFPLRLLDADSAQLRRFVHRFQGDEGRIARGVTLRRLYTAQDQTPDSVLAIVGEVLKVDPEILQREIPGWFELGWNGARLEVRVAAEGAAAGTPLQRLHRTLRRPLGEARLRIMLDRRDALTLYRVAAPGVPAIVPALP